MKKSAGGGTVLKITVLSLVTSKVFHFVFGSCSFTMDLTRGGLLLISPTAGAWASWICAWVRPSVLHGSQPLSLQRWLRTHSVSPLFLGLLPQTVLQSVSAFIFLAVWAASGLLLLTDFLFPHPTASVFSLVIMSVFLAYYQSFFNLPCHFS